MKKISFVILANIGLVSCAQNSSIIYPNTQGKPTIYEDVTTSSSAVAGIGIESQDIASMTDQMMRDMMQNKILMSAATPPRVVIDSEYFTNESTSRINRNMLTDRLRINLTRAANGRMVFPARHLSAMVEKERELKRDGAVDGGTIRSTQATAGADYRLGGRITSLDAMDSNTQMKSRYHQVTFEMVDLELGTIIWSGIYEFKKTTQDDIIYR
jgi:PBP1b-binding outer membrane lipoprotein LpoB